MKLQWFGLLVVLTASIGMTSAAYGGIIDISTKQTGWTVSWNVTDCTDCTMNSAVNQPVAEVTDSSMVEPIPNYGYPLWTASTATSKWIAPQVAGLTGSGITMEGRQFGVGTYEYTFTFDLGNYAPGTAQFSGRYWADGRLASYDNEGPSIRVNGIDVPDSAVEIVGPPDSYSVGGMFLLNDSLVSQIFNLPAGTTGLFQAGVNTITFRVNNRYRETGLRVEGSGTFQQIPEPGTWLLVSGGLMGLALLRRRS